MVGLNDLLIATGPLDIQAIANIDVEELIAQLEPIYEESEELTEDQLLRLRDLKSAAIAAWDLIRAVESETAVQSPVNVSQRGWYAVGVMEEILYRNPRSPVRGDMINLHSAASSFAQAGEYKRSLHILDEALQSAEIRPGDQAYLESERARVRELDSH